MKSLFTLLRLVASAIVAIFALDSIVTHFRSTSFTNHNRIQPEVSTQHFSPSSELASHDHASQISGPGADHQRFHAALKAKEAYTVTSWASADRETQHYTLERTYASSKDIPSQSVLFLTITRDDHSWGRNPDEAPRTIYSFLDFITNTTLTPSAASVALLTSSPEEFERYKQILTPSQDGAARPADSPYFDYPFHRVMLVLHTAATRAPRLELDSSPDHSGKSSKDNETSNSRSDRHSIPQHERRAILAKLRNYLQSVALAHETHLLWLDSDVYKFNSNTMVETMMKRTTTTDAAEVGILTARCRLGEPEKTDAWLKEHPDYNLPPPPQDNEVEDEKRGVEGGRYEVIAHKLHAQGQYDLNAWRGRRSGPNNIEQEMLWNDLSAWEPHPAPEGRTHILDQAIDKTSDDDLIRLDSVGGTILMFRADLVRMGLNFATGYVVGMTFEHGEGYDGIETEGVCVLSRSFSRDGQSLCYTLGGDWSVWHTVF